MLSKDELAGLSLEDLSLLANGIRTHRNNVSNYLNLIEEVFQTKNADASLRRKEAEHFANLSPAELEALRRRLAAAEPEESKE
jgi:hypothetical protein